MSSQTKTPAKGYVVRVTVFDHWEYFMHKPVTVGGLAMRFCTRLDHAKVFKRRADAVRVARRYQETVEAIRVAPLDAAQDAEVDAGIDPDAPIEYVDYKTAAEYRAEQEAWEKEQKEREEKALRIEAARGVQMSIPIAYPVAA